MQRWAGLILAGALIAAFGAGLFIQPKDSRANLTTDSWHASYFDNARLAGDPIVTRYERSVNYNWAADAPLGVPSDGFSARWIGRFDFDAGTWRFIIGADDGVRLQVDDQLIIDQWQATGQFTTYSADIDLDAGEHTVEVEYYDLTGLAGINVRWQLAPPPSEPAINSEPSDEEDANGGSEPVSTVMGYVATSILDVYAGPGIQYERIGQIYLYQTFPVLQRDLDGSWYELDLQDGRVGWVSSAFVFRTEGELPISLPESSATEANEAARTLSDLRLLDEPSAEGVVLDTMPTGTDITVLGRSGDSLWYLVQREELDGWVFAPSVELLDSLPVDIPVVQ
jgi:hypothetical protein